MLSIIKKLKTGGKGERAYGNNLTAYWKKWLKTKYTHTWLDPPCAPIECWLRVTEENLDFFEWDKNHDGIVTKKEIKELTFIDPGTESSFDLLSDKR